jgi:transposase-like protein
MGNKIQVPNRQYTDEFRFEAVRLVESIGGNAAAKRLGIPDSSLWNWLRLSRAGKLKVKHSTAAQAELRCRRVGGGERTAAPGVGERQVGP